MSEGSDYLSEIFSEENDAKYLVKRKSQDNSRRNCQLENGALVPLQSENKGYQLLSKLGYGGSGGLGREGQGISEPLNALADTLHYDTEKPRVGKRSHGAASVGLGIQESKKRQLKEFERLKEEEGRRLQSLESDYKLSLGRKANQLKALRLIKSAQNIIFELEEKSGGQSSFDFDAELVDVDEELARMIYVELFPSLRFY